MVTPILISFTYSDGEISLTRQKANSNCFKQKGELITSYNWRGWAKNFGPCRSWTQMIPDRVSLSGLTDSDHGARGESSSCTQCFGVPGAAPSTWHSVIHLTLIGSLWGRWFYYFHVQMRQARHREIKITCSGLCKQQSHDLRPPGISGTHALNQGFRNSGLQAKSCFHPFL